MGANPKPKVSPEAQEILGSPVAKLYASIKKTTYFLEEMDADPKGRIGQLLAMQDGQVTSKTPLATKGDARLVRGRAKFRDDNVIQMIVTDETSGDDVEPLPDNIAEIKREVESVLGEGSWPILHAMEIISTSCWLAHRYAPIPNLGRIVYNLDRLKKQTTTTHAHIYWLLFGAQVLRPVLDAQANIQELRAGVDKLPTILEIVDSLKEGLRPDGGKDDGWKQIVCASLKGASALLAAAKEEIEKSTGLFEYNLRPDEETIEKIMEEFENLK